MVAADLAFVRPTHHDVSFQALFFDLRQRAGLSQTRVARLANIDPGYVNRLERGTSQMPSRKIVLALAAAVDASLVDTERLLLAAGLCPEFLLALSPERFTALVRLLEVAS